MSRSRTNKPGFRCASCGEWHDELPTDIACGLPDEVFVLDYLQRYQRARYNQDFCTLDERRWFIRCVLPVPFTYRADFFGWGVWVEVGRRQHDAYLRYFGADSPDVTPPDVEGTVANKLRVYRNTLGLRVRLDMAHDRRPLAWLTATSRHTLAREQRKGIDAERHHALALPLGG